MTMRFHTKSGRCENGNGIKRKIAGKSGFGIGIAAVFVALFILCPYVWEWSHPGFPTDWSAWWAFGTFIVVVVAAVFTYSEYVERKEDYVSQVCPYVQVRLIPERSAVMLEIENIGKTPAKDIKVSRDVEFDELLSPKDGDWEKFVKESLDTLFKDGLAFLAPRQHVRYYVDLADDFYPRMNERRDSLRTIVTVEYVDSHGNRYDEGFPINAADYINAVREKSDSELLEKEVRKVGKELNRSGDAIARAISAKCD